VNRLSINIMVFIFLERPDWLWVPTKPPT